MSYDIPLFDLNFSETEVEAVSKTVKSGWISMGAQTKELETRFAEHLDVEHVIAVTNCTAALHLATEILVGPGDEVIVPSLTFVATANAVRYTGATPVFADITSFDNLTISPEDVRNKITPRTKAILPMHYAGFPCDMDALRVIADENQLFIIEDAAHAPDSKYDGVALGTIGDMGCFSFYSNKNMTSAEGGLLVTSNDEYARRARLMRSHGMTTLSWDRAQGHATEYDVVELGYNYRIDDIRASLALAQMDGLRDDTDRRRGLRKAYIDGLAGIDDIVIPFQNHGHDCCNYIFVVVLKEGGAERRHAVREYLKDKGIETSVHYPAVHRFKVYAGNASGMDKTEHVTDHLITLPLFYNLTEEQVIRVCDTLREALAA